MGKASKRRSRAHGDPIASNNALADQMEDDAVAQPTGRMKRRRGANEEDERNKERYVESKLAKKILKEARRQQQELEEEFGGDDDADEERKEQITKLGNDANDKEAESDDETLGQADQEKEQDQFYESIQLDPNDEKALEQFRSADPAPRKTLADYIMEKLREKKTEIETQFSDAGSDRIERRLDSRVVSLYKGVREVLSKYRAGKLPKAFKMIPALSNWEQVLHVTRPDNWSAAAMYQATRLFASNLKEPMAQRFFNLILLPRIRDDIAEYKRLNFHLYQALKKALHKPGAFFKGIVLPLCEGGDCTLREAVIISSVITKCTIPMLHSAAAMLKIAEMDYSGGNSVFLHALVGKKYALPYRVVDAMVAHFLRFMSEKRELPVLWHQVLLEFVQIYGPDLASEQKEALLELIKAQRHDTLSPEIRSALHKTKCRDVEVSEPPLEPQSSTATLQPQAREIEFMSDDDDSDDDDKRMNKIFG